MEVIFNTYGTDYAELQGSLNENKEIYSKMKKDELIDALKQGE